MCGFTGFISPNSFDNQYLNSMSKILSHRGPNDNGSYVDDMFNFNIAHNRLSIIDLNKTGSQPMISNSGNVLVYNGEIYNYKKIRSEIIKEYNITFKGQSDTEVLLYLIDKKGVQKSLNIIDGMFSFCYYDNVDKKLYFVRDKMGEKPLYYGFNGSTFFFSSELKALHAHKSFKPSISKKSFKFLRTLNYIPSPYSIFENIFKLKPSHYFVYDLKKNNKQKISQIKYWHNKININKSLSFDQTKVILKKKLYEIIESELVADVDVGIFLSSGIDSSLVASIANKVSKKKINTFSLGFNDSYFDESKDALKIAEYIGTNHRSVYLNENDYLNSISKINKVYCEPFSDSSQIVTIPLCEYASRFVKVCLSGDGGDELFCGYNRYIHANKLEKYFNNKLGFFEDRLLKILTRINNQYFNNFLVKIDQLIPNRFRIDNILLKLKKMQISKENSKNFFEYYIKNLSHNPEIITSSISDFNFMNENFTKENELKNSLMLFDQMNYLPDDIVVKMERASMAHSLEVRSPFLHSDIVNLSNTIPLQYKTNNKEGKLITRSILEDFLPKNFINKKKQGFIVPLEKLLKTSMKEWAEKILFSERVKEHSFFDIDNARSEWIKFQNNEIVNFYKFWDIIIFQSWYEEYF